MGMLIRWQGLLRRATNMGPSRTMKNTQNKPFKRGETKVKNIYSICITKVIVKFDQFMHVSIYYFFNLFVNLICVQNK